ncbi:MAG: ferrous iron transport protein B [Planctomycetes bacterium]|nr:ferrous iron transport protein B [Planctomycetota bacterium]
MSRSTSDTVVTVALVGNPNTGKSTLFNALVGARQRVGNYPGVTVEKKVGQMRAGQRAFTLVDLPGTYSLAPRSPDEMVAVDVLLGRRDQEQPPQAVICIVDASNLERNLYLVSQVLELELPTIVALNMTDVADSRGIEIDTDRLRRQLGVPVIALQAHRRKGVDELKNELLRLEEISTARIESPFPQVFQDELASLQATIAHSAEQSDNGAVVPPRYLIERLLLDTSGYIEEALLADHHDEVAQQLTAARGRLADAGCAVPGVEAIARYDWVGRVLEGVVKRPTKRQITPTDKIDRVLTHKLWGTIIFAALMLLMFSSVFTWAKPLMGWIELCFAALGGLVEANMAQGALRSLIVDGVIAGVGGVLVFLPQIFILFFFIAVLEDCGYMARAAYLMDKVMVQVGLSGKSFIPLLSSFACAIPGVMAARVIENRRDRLATIMIAPLMSCSARLPVYTLLIAAFMPPTVYLGGVVTLQGLTMLAMYMVGIVAAVIVAFVLKKTFLRGETPPFVMELPSYKIPSVRVVLHRVFDRGWAFVRRAGTLIFAVTVVVWAAAYYPHDADQIERSYKARVAALDREIEDIDTDDASGDSQRQHLQKQLATALQDPDKEKEGLYLEESYLGTAGKAIEPVVRPLGWDWKIGCAAMASFPAREVVIGTLGVIYKLGPDIDTDDQKQATALRGQLQAATWNTSREKVYNIPVALSIMVFFALCAQCAATLVVIKRETNSWRWPLFTFAYMTTLAYLAALVTYQVGMLI